jgi:hypothetical protein
MASPNVGPAQAPQRLVVVAFWRRLEGQDTEFLIPLNGAYLDVMGIRTDARSAVAARSWMEVELGLTPRGNVRIFAGATGDVAAVALTDVEAAHLTSFGMWLTLDHVEPPALYILRHTAERL